MKAMKPKAFAGAKMIYLKLFRYFRTRFDNAITIVLLIGGIVRIAEIEYGAIEREKILSAQIAECYKNFESTQDLRYQIGSLKESVRLCDSLSFIMGMELDAYRLAILQNYAIGKKDTFIKRIEKDILK